MKKKLLIIVISLFLIPSLSNAQTLFSEVENSLMCTCGSTMVLSSCQCGTADKMRAKIKAMIAQGMTKDEILASYVKIFGETVLSAPTKKGFNLTAWITPFVVIIIVGFVLYKAVHKWSGKNTRRIVKIPDDLLLDYGSKLKNELDNFDDGEII